MYYRCAPNQHLFAPDNMGWTVNGTDLFPCVVGSINAGFVGASAGVATYDATVVCDENVSMRDGYATDAEKTCISDAFGVTSNILKMGRYISTAVNTCAPSRNLDAACAAMAVELSASL